MLFLLLFTLFFGLQVMHRRLLMAMLPRRMHHWIAPALALIHAPLVLYMALRFAGKADYGLLPWLRPWARGAFYFQAATLINLLVGYGAEGLWRLSHLKRHGMEPHDPARRTFLQRVAAGSLGAVAVGASWGAANASSQPKVTRLDLRFPELPPGLDGLKLVHLTDLHAGPMAGMDRLLMWRRFAERERPELLLITGDFVDSVPEEAAPLLEAFANFPAPLGRYAILGNHDYFTNPQPIWQGLDGIGIHCLENRHVRLQRGDSTFVVMGLQDPMARDGRFRGIRFGPGPMPQDLALDLPPDTWRLCLCHRPSNWNLAREAGADLTLSGHTHGGQINLIPGVSSAKLLGRYTQGVYRHGKQVMFVSRGLGVVGLPLRVAAPPEIAVITLRRG